MSVEKPNLVTVNFSLSYVSLVIIHGSPTVQFSQHRRFLSTAITVDKILSHFVNRQVRLRKEKSFCFYFSFLFTQNVLEVVFH